MSIASNHYFNPADNINFSDTNITETINIAASASTEIIELISGDQDNNLLIGNNENNLIYGAKGNDVMIGGGGKDIFFFKENDGSDVIMDFQPGVDQIQLDIYSQRYLSNGITEGHIVQQPIEFNDLTISYENGNAIIKVPQTLESDNSVTTELSNVITLIGIAAPDTLTEADFIFGTMIG